MDGDPIVIKLRALTITDNGDQSRVLVTVEDAGGNVSTHEYFGLVTSGLTIRSTGLLHAEVTVTPTGTLKKDKVPNSKFPG